MPVSAEYNNLQVRLVYDVVGMIAGPIITMGFIHLAEADSKVFGPWGPYMLSILCGSAYVSTAMAQLVIYFGIPPALTLGYQIGKIAPAACTPDNPNGLPCLLKGIAHQSMRLVQGHRNTAWGLLRPQERELLVFAVIALIPLALATFLMPPVLRHALRCSLAEQLMFEDIDEKLYVSVEQGLDVKEAARSSKVDEDSVGRGRNGKRDEKQCW